MGVVSVIGIGHEVAVDLHQQSGGWSGQEGEASKDKQEPKTHEDKLELTAVFHHPLLNDEVICMVTSTQFTMGLPIPLAQDSVHGVARVDMTEPLNHQPPLFLTEANRVATTGETAHQYGGGEGRVWWILASENFCLDTAHGTFTHISLTKVSQMTTTIF